MKTVEYFGGAQYGGAQYPCNEQYTQTHLVRKYGGIVLNFAQNVHLINCSMICKKEIMIMQQH